MIVQMAEEQSPHFVMTMDQHTALSAQFAEHFGNEQFEAVEPREQMLHVIANHDAGWKDLDKMALRDPATGLPYNLVQTPFEHIVATSKASPDFNGATHPYCELLSSMHSWGLYNGRYGMSDKVLLDSLADDNRAAADLMYAEERAARAAKAGIWNHPFYRVRAPDEAGKDIGSFQVIEGRILDAARVKGRVYLNFGADWRTDFTIAIGPQAAKMFRADGRDPLALKGAIVRVRGWLKRENGPMIELSHPEPLEVPGKR